MSEIKIRVFATFRFVAFHQWPGAPDDCSYLRFPHRHVFHVRVEKAVSHGDREIEFITLKKEAEELVRTKNGDGTENWSCETWARFLLDRLELMKCEVSEDGENGSTVEVDL